MAKLSPDKLPNCSATFTIYSISKTKLAAGNFSNQLSSTAENIINSHVAVAFFFVSLEITGWRNSFISE
jgi:hypothetical protein